MSIRVSGATLGEIQKLFGWGAMGTWTDSQLVDHFVGGREASEAAFRVLIQRHGPMVLGVCRRILGDEHAAEDAFQATFLVFVKKAGMLRDRGLLTNWLYGVALKISNKERARGERRRVVERRAAEQAPRIAGEPEPSELRSSIDEEIRRLPEHYRVPLLLCHVEGLRHDEVARRLGCPVGTVESRLSRARERLRSRLVRRGLAPSASAMGALLEPLHIGLLPTALVESTVRSALKSPALKIGPLAPVGATLVLVGRTVAGRTAGAGTAAATLVICMGIAGAVIGAFRPDAPEPDRPPPTPAAAVRRADLTTRIEARRTPQAIARPISGITIDGRLDDWPAGLKRYPICNVLTTRTQHYRDNIKGTSDIDAEFVAGYDRKAGLIYLAVVVRDDDPVLKRSSSPQENDAVEIYVDGTFSDIKVGGPSWDDFPANIDAEHMPVLQYVGLAGELPAYGDRFGANPSLVYARSREPNTRMKYRRQGNTTTYEWAIQAYDRYPDAPTRLEPGKRIGLDVAVVDKDSGRTKPAFLTWASPPEAYKFLHAGSLGELYLADGP